MSSHGLTRENLIAALPLALRGDPSAAALAEITASLLAQRPEEIDRLRIYPAIDRLDGALLDILARDFKVDWWDADYSLTEKRRTLKDSWRVHKLLGTKAAVETALSAIYPGAKVEEWFEYGGQPYHFRVHVNILDAEYDPKKNKRIMQRVLWYKNLRSHLERIWYDLPPIVFEETGDFRFRSLRIRLHANNYGCIFLDGRRRLDGTWLLDQSAGRLWMVHAGIRMRARMPHRLGVRILRAGGIGVRTAERVPLHLDAAIYTFDNTGGCIFLDGDNRLDGTWLLSQLPRSPVFRDFLTAFAVPERREALVYNAARVRLIQRSDGGRIRRLGLIAAHYSMGPPDQRLSGDLSARVILREAGDPHLQRLTLAAAWETAGRFVIPLPTVLSCRWRHRQDLSVRGLRLNESTREPAGGGHLGVCAGGIDIRDTAGGLGRISLGVRKLERFDGVHRMDGTTRFNGGSVVDNPI